MTLHGSKSCLFWPINTRSESSCRCFRCSYSIIHTNTLFILNHVSIPQSTHTQNGIDPAEEKITTQTQKNHGIKCCKQTYFPFCSSLYRLTKYCFQYFSVLLFLGKKVHFHELRRNTTCTVCPACYFNTNTRLFLTQFLKQLLGLGSGQLFTISKPF